MTASPEQFLNLFILRETCGSLSNDLYGDSDWLITSFEKYLTCMKLNAMKLKDAIAINEVHMPIKYTW